MSTSISALQAAAGRFLTASGASAWEAASKGRHEALVRSFQQQQLGPAELAAALGITPSSRSDVSGSTATDPSRLPIDTGNSMPDSRKEDA